MVCKLLVLWGKKTLSFSCLSTYKKGIFYSDAGVEKNTINEIIVDLKLDLEYYLLFNAQYLF